MKRRLFLSVLAIAMVFMACQDSSKLTISHLQCEYLDAPLAIDNTSPHFSWEMACKQHGATSTAYQILVATELAKLNETEADLWNSNKVADSRSIGIEYAGKPLASRSLAYWKVRVWNKNDEASEWSTPSSFGVGMLHESDWSANARFIGVEQTDKESQITPLLRKAFTYEPSPEKVLLSVNSLGYHEAYINGLPVSDAVLAPAVSQWSKRSQIVTYDVTPLLKKGENELVLWTGIGWYQPHNSSVVPNGPYVRAQLDALSLGNVKTLAATDATWQWAESGRRTFGTWRPHQMGGEIVDARTTPSDLRPATLDKLTWNPVVVADIPTHSATPQMCELNKKIKSFHPVKVQKDEDGWYIYDMGTNFVGFTEVKMPAVAIGQQIELHYDDYFLTDSVGFREGLYTDYFIGNGKAGHTFSSKFNYKGYRYLKIIGLSEALPLQDITASTVRTDYSGKATFTCSDEDMNAIYNMVHNTLENLSLGGYIVDCPQIERLGYGGDGNASALTAQTFFNLAPLYLNWIQAWSDSQRPDGGMPHTAPNPYTAGGGPYWCGFIIPASWLTYVNYGDMRLMERYYPVMQNWLKYAESYQVDGLLKQWPNTEYRGWYLGDWVPPTGINPQDPRSIDIVNNCFLTDCYGMMIKIATTLGKEADIPSYAQKQEALKTRIHETFFHAENNHYASSSQIDLIYPMLAGVTPPSLKEKVKEALFQETAGRFNGHIATGLVGISILTQWATQNQEAEFVYGMLKKRTYPGYLYMIDHGATLTWEEWDGERSQLHNCYNAIGSWFIQALAGITPDESSPGYKHVNIRPQWIEGITWVKASKDTPYGVLEVNWERRANEWIMEINIPVGSSATVHCNEKIELPSGKHRISCKI